MLRNHDPHSLSLLNAIRLSRREALARLIALPAALGLVAPVAPESAEARKKRRKKRRKRRGKHATGGGSNPGGDPGGGGSSPEDEERAFLILLNTYRETKDRNPLRRHDQLDAAAERHSQDMAANGFFDHRGSDGSRADDRIADAGYDWRAWGENVFWSKPDGSAQAAFTWWKNSPGHNANMLSRNFTEIGIGRARSDSGWWYWTTTFGRR